MSSYTYKIDWRPQKGRIARPRIVPQRYFMYRIHDYNTPLLINLPLFEAFLTKIQKVPINHHQKNLKSL